MTINMQFGLFCSLSQHLTTFQENYHSHQLMVTLKFNYYSDHNFFSLCPLYLVLGCSQQKQLTWCQPRVFLVLCYFFYLSSRKILALGTQQVQQSCKLQKSYDAKMIRLLGTSSVGVRIFLPTCKQPLCARSRQFRKNSLWEAALKSHLCFFR